MEKITLPTLLLFCLNFCFAQKSQDSLKTKTNPILYIEGIVGYSGGSLSGLTAGATANFQTGKNLFTFRALNQTKITAESAQLSPFTYIPIFYVSESLDEFSLLYGRRYIDKNKSYSFSIGTSYNKWKKHEDNYKKSYIGLPIELNIKWFKPNKKRFRAYYGLIPIGKPTAFGRSFGFKLYGNIGELSYIGLGISLSYGWHKKY